MRKPIKQTDAYELHYDGGKRFTLWWRDRMICVNIHKYGCEFNYQPYILSKSFPKDEIEEAINDYLEEKWAKIP